MARDNPHAAASTRVLVVDDELHVLDALRVILEAQGYHVQLALNGPAALEAAAAVPPDVVVLDLAMPRMDGIEVAQRLREWTDVPILVLSARTDELQKVRALDAGADDYVTKPFGTHELLARIRAAVRREHARRIGEPIVRVEELEVDLARRRVTRSGLEVHLTPSEFAVLRVLAGNADRVLTHNFLLMNALGPDYEQAEETLRTYIKQLRRKIEPDPSRPRIIVTEPGVGYRFRLSD